MDRQNQMTELLVHQQKLSLLPAREITTFGGDPMDYQSFISAFQHGIESNTNIDRDRLYYLEQYTTGQARELVRSCQHMDPTRGYAEARRLLEQHFGDKIKITNAYIQKALNWPHSIAKRGGDALSKETQAL